MPKISIIVPIYNVEKYIKDCLTSLINQTLNDIEIICVNDGTEDKSMSIVKEFQKKDEKITIINQKNKGLSQARNNGLKIAKGKYIYFLDSDDTISTEALETLYKIANSKNLDILYFDGKTNYESDEVKKEFSKYENYYQRNIDCQKVIDGQAMFLLMKENNSYRANVATQLYKKDFLIKNKIRFIPNIYHEDEEFSLKTSLYAKKTFYIKKDFYIRRVRENSIMTSNDKKFKSSYGYYYTIFKILPLIEKEIKDEHILNVYLNHLNDLKNSSIEEAKEIKEKNNLLKIKNIKEKVLFKYIILDNAKVKQKNEKLNLLLKRANDKKNKLKKIRKKIVRKVKTLLKVTIPNIFRSKSKIPQVSIILPIYNVEKYLDETIKSLLKQTMKNIEIICIDDGSTDKSLEIAQFYSKKHSNIKIIAKKHEGAGIARNIGIKNAKGEYLLILDSDDIFEPTLCEKAYNRAKLFNADVILFQANKYETSTKEIKKFSVLNDNGLPKEKTFNSQSVADKIFQITPANPWSKIWKRKFIIANNIEFQNTKNANDVFFTLIALTKAERIAILKENLVNYRVGNKDSTQSTKHKAPLEFYKAFEAVMESLKNEGTFEIYQDSFKKAFTNAIIFNYNTTNTTEAKNIIKEKIMNEGIKKFDLKEITPEIFTNTNNYYEWNKIFSEE